MRLLKFLLFALCIEFVFSFFPVMAETQRMTDQLPESYTGLSKGDTLSVRRLLDQGISINATNKIGESLLMFASYEGDLVKMRYLIRAGAELRQWGGLLKNSPLDYAVAGRKEEAVDLLLASGVDINERSPWGVTAVCKAGWDGNYRMFRYLIGKGAVLSDPDKIDLLIFCVNSFDNREVRDRMMREILQDMHVEKKDIFSSPFMRVEPRKEELCQKILSMQDKIAEERMEEEAERCRQDSLRNLLDSGQADTIRYRYYTETNMSKDRKETTSVILVTPRIDDVDNKLGVEATGTFLILLALTFLLLFYLSGLLIKNVYKDKPDFFLHVLNFVLGGFPLYLMISCLYTNLDDIIIRKFGEEKEAKIAAEWVKYQYRSHRGIGTREGWELDFSFLFLNKDSVRISVNQGNCKFDSECREQGISEITVKVRYDEKSMKLAVDDKKYLAQNLAWILFMCFLIVLLLLLCRGKFKLGMKAFNNQSH